jgi:ribonuclease HII
VRGGTASSNRRPAGRRPKGDPDCRFERRLARRGYRSVAGLDEVGRGSWAGPLVAAAVILPRPTPNLLTKLRGLRDSKQLLPTQRERLFAAIHDVALSTGIGLVSSATIDLLGLSAAGQLALERAARALSVVPDYLLIDAFALPGLDCPQEAIIFGDARCLCIAAASVIAKVERDRLMNRLASEYAAFGFERNKGYGTAEHLRALARLGPTPQHRFSYAPVRAVLEGSCSC